MNWIFFAIASFIAFGFQAFFAKIATEKMNPLLAPAVQFVGSLLVAGAILGVLFWKNPTVFSKNEGWIFAFLSGVAAAIAVFAMYHAFASGGNLTTAGSIIRIGAVVAAVILGLIFLREPLNWRLAVGLFLAFGGIYFIATAK